MEIQIHIRQNNFCPSSTVAPPDSEIGLTGDFWLKTDLQSCYLDFWLLSNLLYLEIK